MQPWKTLSRRTILNYSKYLTVEEHTVALPDGRVIPNWPWIITPDYVIVVAVTGDGRFLCFRQTKYAVQGTTLAPVGGYLEPGEDPLAAAQRELLEETGYRAADWIDLGHYCVDGNRGVGTAHLYLALGAHPNKLGTPAPLVGQPCGTRTEVARDSDDLEEQELLYLSREEVEAALSAGAFKLLPWAAAVALGLREMEDNPGELVRTE